MPACIAFLIGIRDQAAFSGYARAAVQDMEYGPVVPVTCHCAPATSTMNVQLFLPRFPK